MSVHEIAGPSLADVPALLGKLAAQCAEDNTAEVFTVRLKEGEIEIRAMGAGLDVFTTYTWLSLACRQLERDIEATARVG